MRRRTFPLPFSSGDYGSVELRLRSSPASLEALEDYFQSAAVCIQVDNVRDHIQKLLFKQSTKNKKKWFSTAQEPYWRIREGQCLDLGTEQQG